MSDLGQVPEALFPFPCRPRCSGVRVFGSGCRARVLMLGDWIRVLGLAYSDSGIRVKVPGLGVSVSEFGLGLRRAGVRAFGFSCSMGVFGLG